jgi:hypothetical protein
VAGVGTGDGRAGRCCGWAPRVAKRRTPATLGQVLFRKRFWAGLEDGSVTVAFRRWRRPPVKPGGALRSPGGLLAIDDVARIGPEAVTDADASAAGYRNRGEVLADLRPEGELHRVRFHRIGDDPRAGLREQADLDDAELDELRRVLVRLPWAVPVLRLIADRPATVSTLLAGEVGLDRPRFKQRVRRLKELGLTESLPVGYRLSPRGEVVLDRLTSS